MASGKNIGGRLDRKLVFRGGDEHQLESTCAGRRWSVKGDDRLFSLGQWRTSRADLTPVDRRAAAWWRWRP